MQLFLCKILKCLKLGEASKMMKIIKCFIETLENDQNMCIWSLLISRVKHVRVCVLFLCSL